MGFFKKTQKIQYDPVRQEPAVRRSICTGEMTVGFIDRETGKFQDLMKVNGQKGLDDFCREIGAKEIKTIY
ncbi:MAG: aspartate dehydrogenase [Clostridia bacterium]|nr:aspartate dehydrogenase [Clostridia bacterium]